MFTYCKFFKNIDNAFVSISKPTTVLRMLTCSCLTIMKWNSHCVQMNTVLLLIAPWSGFYFYALNYIWHFSEGEVKVILVALHTFSLIVQSLDFIKYQYGKHTTCVHWNIMKKVQKLATARKLLNTQTIHWSCVLSHSYLALLRELPSEGT